MPAARWCSTCWPNCCAAATRAGLRAQHHRRRRQDQRRRAGTGRADQHDHRQVHRRLPRGHGRAGREPAGPGAARHRAHPADHRDDRATDRQRPCLCRRRPCAVLGGQLRRLRQAVAPPIRTKCWPARASKWRPTSAIRAISCCGSRPPPTCPAGIRPGASAVRAGTSNARRWPQRTWARPSTSMPAASTCSSRTTRTRSRRATCAHGGKVFARFWLHNGMLNFGGAKMSKSLGNVSVLHELLRQPAARGAALCPAVRPLPAAAGLVGRPDRTERPHAGPAVRNAARPGRCRPPTRRHCRPASKPRCATT